MNGGGLPPVNNRTKPLRERNRGAKTQGALGLVGAAEPVRDEALRLGAMFWPQSRAGQFQKRLHQLVDCRGMPGADVEKLVGRLALHREEIVLGDVIDVYEIIRLG